MKLASKIALLGAFILQPCHWDEQAEAWSRALPHDWPGSHAGVLAEAVKSGRASMLNITHNGKRVGFIVYRIDRDFTLPEFEIIAAYSGEGRIDVTASCLDQLADLAAREGCASIRFHTMRPGLIAKAEAAGYRVSEVIMRRDVKKV